MKMEALSCLNLYAAAVLLSRSLGPSLRCELPVSAVFSVMNVMR